MLSRKEKDLIVRLNRYLRDIGVKIGKTSKVFGRHMCIKYKHYENEHPIKNVLDIVSLAEGRWFLRYVIANAKMLAGVIPEIPIDITNSAYVYVKLSRKLQSIQSESLEELEVKLNLVGF